MRLSVILPCFNGAATIAVQLEALTRQTWSDGWEVVVCNNGSTDASMAIVAEYRDRLPGLRIVEVHEGTGPAEQRPRLAPEANQSNHRIDELDAQYDWQARIDAGLIGISR